MDDFLSMSTLTSGPAGIAVLVAIFAIIYVASIISGRSHLNDSECMKKYPAMLVNNVQYSPAFQPTTGGCYSCPDGWNRTWWAYPDAQNACTNGSAMQPAYYRGGF